MTRLSRREALLGLPLLAAAAACRRDPPLPIEPIGGEFALTDHFGQPFTLSSLRGRAVLIFFGYTFCPDVCPTTMSKLSVVYRKLGEQRREVKTLYISVDPERDTPAVLKADLSAFSADALGLTGTRAEVDAVVALYGAAYRIEPTPESAAKYTVSHSTTLYLLDRRGRTRMRFRYQATADEIVSGVQQVLRERG